MIDKEDRALDESMSTAGPVFSDDPACAHLTDVGNFLPDQHRFLLPEVVRNDALRNYRLSLPNSLQHKVEGSERIPRLRYR